MSTPQVKIVMEPVPTQVVSTQCIAISATMQNVLHALTMQRVRVLHVIIHLVALEQLTVLVLEHTLV